MKTSKLLRDVSRNTSRIFDVGAFLSPPMPLVRINMHRSMVIRSVEDAIASDLDAIRGDYERVISRYEQEHASA